MIKALSRREFDKTVVKNWEQLNRSDPRNEDFTQAAALEALEKRDKISWGAQDGNAHEHVASFMFSVKKAKRIDAQRKNKRLVSLEGMENRGHASREVMDRALVVEDDPIEWLLSQENIRLLRDIFGELPPLQKKIVGLVMASGGAMATTEIADRLETTDNAVRASLSYARDTLRIHRELAESGDRCRTMQSLIPLKASGELSKELSKRLTHHLRWSPCKECRRQAAFHGISVSRAFTFIPALLALLRFRGGEGVATKATAAGGVAGSAAGGSALLTAGSGKLALLGCASVLCVGGIGLGVREVSKHPKLPAKAAKTRPNPAVVSGALEDLERQIDSSKKKPKKKPAQTPPTENEGQDSTEPVVSDDVAPPKTSVRKTFIDDAEPPVSDDVAPPTTTPATIFSDDAKGSP